jgi:hypothetical protein
MAAPFQVLSSNYLFSAYMKKILLLALAGLAFTSACKKDDNTPATMQVTGSLSAANEVPAVSAPGATGAFTGSYNPSSMVLTYAVTYSGLTGPATAAHLHFGDTKHKTAAPTVPFANVPSMASGTFNGMATLTSMQADSLKAGKLYANIHTDTNKNGEIRANLTAK